MHRLHSDYPLVPERLTIDESMLSPLQQTFPSEQKKTSVKLTPNLQDKQNYVTHYRNLKFYLENGMVIKKIHRILTFKQSPWLKVYIDFNTLKRSESMSKFGKDSYKLMNNAVYGKTNENLRNRVNVEVVRDREVALKRACKPTFKRSLTVQDDLVIMQCIVANLELNKPVYVGFSILDLSKLLMYQFHYEKMLLQYQRINLCFTDTDSLLYEVFTTDIYADMYENKEEYDFSEYPFIHPNYDKTNKKVIGKFKDELNGLPLEEFVGLRAKCYSLRYYGKVENNIVEHENASEMQKAKGTKECVKEAHLRHTHYKECVKNHKTYSLKQNVMRSKGHNIGTYHQTKIALSAYDTKRWICENGIDTLAYGHFKTEQE